MGAALLLHWRPDVPPDVVDQSFARVESAFPAHITRDMQVRRVSEDGLRAAVWSHEMSLADGLARSPDGRSWLMLLGNPHRADLAAVEGGALQARLLEECLSAGRRCLDSLSPPFGAVFHDGRTGETTIVVDRCGLQGLYVHRDRDGGIWVSSSVLALASALGVALDEEGVAEWIGAGHFISQRTLFRGIRKLDCGAEHRLTAEGAPQERRWVPGTPQPATPGEYREALLRSIADCRRPELLAGELTGGLDSRLIWAGMLHHGIPAFAWTVGQPGSVELRTVERLLATSPIPHLTVPVGAHLAPRIPELLERMHRLSEGEVNALEYAPLLVAFDALDGRRAVSFSGGGGELARGFYFSALHEGNGDGGISIPALVARLGRLSGRLPAGLRRERVPASDDVLRRTLEDFLRDSSHLAPAARLDDLYLRGRMQRFAGRNVTTTGLFGRQALPYFDNALVEVSMGLPAAAKVHSTAMRQALQRLSPVLAGVPLDTGEAAGDTAASSLMPRLRSARTLARKALVRYGGEAGRAISLAPPDPFPWTAVRAHEPFRTLVGDLLLSHERRCGMLVASEVIDATVRDGLDRGRMYPLGLLLSLELTLRHVGAS